MSTQDKATQQRKKDALDLALLLYDIYQEEKLDISVGTDQNDTESQPCQNDP